MALQFNRCGMKPAIDNGLVVCYWASYRQTASGRKCELELADGKLPFTQVRFLTLPSAPAKLLPWPVIN